MAASGRARGETKSWDRIPALAAAGLVLASVVLPSIGSAGSERHRPFYDVSLADVGTWDAVLTVRLRDGRFETRHGVEVNTIGCGGTCVRAC